jgi:uncharacterized protein with PhoU and TrkA domain
MNRGMSIQTAINCFNEIKLYSNTQTDPATYNLYTGLYQIALAIKQLESEIDAVKRTLTALKVKSANKCFVFYASHQSFSNLSARL